MTGAPWPLFGRSGPRGRHSLPSRREVARAVPRVARDRRGRVCAARRSWRTAALDLARRGARPTSALRREPWIRRGEQCRRPRLAGRSPAPQSRHQLVDGTLERLVQAMRDRPRVGLVAVRQVAGDGTLWPSLHRFPSVGRAMAAALASEKWPVLGERLGERARRGRVRAHGHVRLDDRRGARRSPRGIRGRGRVRRALFGGDRSVQAHTGPGLGGARRAGRHVRPSCGQGGRAPGAGGADGTRANAVRAQARRPCPRRVVSSGPAGFAAMHAAAREHADVERARSSPGAARVARPGEAPYRHATRVARAGSDGRRHGAPVSPGRRTSPHRRLRRGHALEREAGSSRPISTSFASTRQAPRRAS